MKCQKKGEGFLSISYYFECSYPLGVGSVIKKGNWGRCLTIIGAEHPAYPREHALESIREEHYPDKLNRIDGVFLRNSSEDCMTFCQSAGKVLDIIYEVELVDLDANRHVGYIEWCTPTKVSDEEMVSNAHKY